MPSTHWVLKQNLGSAVESPWLTICDELLDEGPCHSGQKGKCRVSGHHCSTCTLHIFSWNPIPIPGAPCSKRGSDPTNRRAAGADFGPSARWLAGACSFEWIPLGGSGIGASVEYPQDSPAGTAGTQADGLCGPAQQLWDLLESHKLDMRIFLFFGKGYFRPCLR